MRSLLHIRNCWLRTLNKCSTHLDYTLKNTKQLEISFRVFLRFVNIKNTLLLEYFLANLDHGFFSLLSGRLAQKVTECTRCFSTLFLRRIKTWKGKTKHIHYPFPTIHCSGQCKISNSKASHRKQKFKYYNPDISK